MAGVSGVALRGTGGFGYNLIVVMIGCGNILTALNHFTTLGTNLITSIAVFCAACRFHALSLSIEMITNFLTTNFLVTYRTINNRIVAICRFILDHRSRGCMFLARLHYPTTYALDGCDAVVIVRQSNTLVNQLEVVVGSAGCCSLFPFITGFIALSCVIQ